MRWSPNARPGQSSREGTEWRIQVGRSDQHRFDLDDFFPGRFHRGFFPGGAFGLYSYPFYDYGLGLFSYCPDWLVPDWEWQEYYSGECEAYAQPQDSSIVAYGTDESYSADQGYSAPQADTPQVYGHYERNPPATASEQGDASGAGNEHAVVNAANGSRHPGTLIYLADGTNYVVTNYWLGGGDLHYVTSYGAEDSVPFGQIDLQRTVDANAAQGVAFTLRPAPGSGVSEGGR